MTKAGRSFAAVRSVYGHRNQDDLSFHLYLTLRSATL
jgi:hypothetical protein